MMIMVFKDRLRSALFSVLRQFIPKRVRVAVRLGFDAYWGKLTFAEDCLYTYVHADFLRDEKFLLAYQKGHALMLPSWGEYHFRWRAYVVCWAAHKAQKLQGDFVECGVNTGMLARMIIEYIDFPTIGKKFYLLDTYEGMAPAYSTSREMERSESMGYTDVYDQVRATFAPYNTKIIKGAVPDTLSQIDTDKICFLSIDMNTALPEQKALEFCWDKLVSGAVVILDDYGFTGHEEQKRLHDAFAASKGVMVLALPTGQGLIFKP